MANWSWGRRRGMRAGLAVPLLAAAVAGGGLAVAAPPPARAAASSQVWGAELAVDGGDDTNVVAAGGGIRLGTGNVTPLSAQTHRTQGELILPPRQLAGPVTRVSAEVTADVPPGAEVDVDVRGTRADGSWGEWTPARPGRPATLAEPTSQVEVKAVLISGPFGAGPALQRLLLTADPGAAAPSAPLPPTTPGPVSTPKPPPATTPPATTPPATKPPVSKPPVATPPTTKPPATTPPTTTPPTTTAPTTTPPTTKPPATTPPTTTPPTTKPPAPTTPASPARPPSVPGVPLYAPPFSTKVYATREGLVGNSTANGHVITPDDRFVALPSRSALNTRGAGDYTVQVCANGRCAWAPVWDVGPWNTTDDYWDAATDRESWNDLTQGVPEAQAAFQGNYNGGLDGFGRRIGNPAGIDLADGTFRDDLQLGDNSWVDVSYLWSGRGPTGVAQPGPDPSLVVRSSPDDSAPDVGGVAAQARVLAQCTVAGGSHRGTQGTSNQWLRLGPDQFVPAAGVEVSRVAPC